MLNSNNNMKQQTLAELANLVDAANSKVNVLAALDGDVTTPGVGDLADQLTTMRTMLSGLEAVTQRAQGVVPE